MVKRIGLSVALLAGLAALAAPRQAKAETHFGIYITPAPRVYTAPAYGYGYDPYAYDPYGNYYSAPAPDYYSYPAPVYVAPSYGYYGRGWRDHDRHEWLERQRHEEHEWREHHGWRR